AHSQKGIPAFSIYGHDVQDADDTSIPADVEEKLLRFARAGLAIKAQHHKAYMYHVYHTDVAQHEDYLPVLYEYHRQGIT
ncbi:hypothetical protein F6S25_32210, partial [Klebsiella pneumoniae]|nr:hypothetical protein [Klebsiella pneumoniae]